MSGVDAAGGLASDLLICPGCDKPVEVSELCWCRHPLCWPCHDDGAHHWPGEGDAA